MKINDTQIAALTSCAALLPLGAILAPVYGITHHLKKSEPDVDAKFKGYNFQSIGQITLVSFIWIASASHNYYLLLGLLAGVAASNIANTGSLPVEEYNAVKSSLDTALGTIQEVDFDSIPQNAKLQFEKLKNQYQLTLKKIKGLNSKSVPTVELELNQEEEPTNSAQDTTTESIDVEKIDIEVKVENPVEVIEPIVQIDTQQAVELTK
jgi:hypothetical protein